MLKLISVFQPHSLRPSTIPPKGLQSVSLSALEDSRMSLKGSHSSRLSHPRRPFAPNSLERFLCGNHV